MKGTAYLIQGALISIWWLGLSVSGAFYAAFQFPSISKTAFNAFLAPDILVVAVLSVVRAYKSNRDLELIILGGFAYASLYCINALILTGGGFLPTTIMILGLCYNFFLVYNAQLFRESASKNSFSNAIKTILQIISVWFLTLVLFPWILMDAFKLPFESSELAQISAMVLFSFASILGLTSAYFLVKNGKGTPLPADQTKKLVVTGPYKVVRNPMAVAGICQGLALALYFYALPILVYSLLGAVIWHFIVRPIEEKNMLHRFGKEYEQYATNVPLWIPKW